MARRSQGLWREIFTHVGGKISDNFTRGGGKISKSCVYSRIIRGYDMAQYEVKRLIFEDILRHLDKKQHTIIVGARQVGKSTIMKQLASELKREGKQTLWLNLEQRDVLEELNKNPLNLFKYMPSHDKNERVVVFIDEVQYLREPANFLKLLYDEYNQQVKIVASGSSAFYIDEKFDDSLAGRKRIFWMRTCSFEEHLLLSGKNDLLQEYKRLRGERGLKSTMLPLIEQEMRNYMRYGGYPAVITETDVEEKQMILNELRDSFVKRDIIEAGVKNTDAFFALFRLIASMNGNLLNINDIAKILRLKNETVQRYIEILVKCCHITLVKPFYRNITKELTKMPKVYVLDSGMKHSLTGRLEQQIAEVDEGQEWESLVYRQLLERNQPEDINFWRTSSGNEVDFVLARRMSPYALEVKRSVGTYKEKKYSMFRDAYPEIKLIGLECTPLTEETVWVLENSMDSGMPQSNFTGCL